MCNAVPAGRTLANAHVSAPMRDRRKTNRTNDVRRRIASPLLPRGLLTTCCDLLRTPTPHDRGKRRLLRARSTIQFKQQSCAHGAAWNQHRSAKALLQSRFLEVSIMNTDWNKAREQ